MDSNLFLATPGEHEDAQLPLKIRAVVEALLQQKDKPGSFSEYELGRFIGLAYISAQGIHQQASNCLCDAMNEATPFMKFGFNQVLQLTPYSTRA